MVLPAWSLASLVNSSYACCLFMGSTRAGSYLKGVTPPKHGQLTVNFDPKDVSM